MAQGPEKDIKKSFALPKDIGKREESFISELMRLILGRDSMLTPADGCEKERCGVCGFSESMPHLMNSISLIPDL